MEPKVDILNRMQTNVGRGPQIDAFGLLNDIFKLDQQGEAEDKNVDSLLEMLGNYLPVRNAVFVFLAENAVDGDPKDLKTYLVAGQRLKLDKHPDSEAFFTGLQNHLAGLEAPANPSEWVNILHTKGMGILSVTPEHGWQINGRPVEEQVQWGSVGEGYVLCGGYGDPDNPSAPYNLMMDSVYSRRHAYISEEMRRANIDLDGYRFVADERIREGKYEFHYIMQCVDRRTRRLGDEVFFFTLPIKEGGDFFEAVKQNPDLIEATFQNMYQGITEPNQLRRKKGQDLGVVYSKVDTSSYPAKFDTHAEKVKFSQPVGEY